MSYQPLISKIRCHSPNKRGSKQANRANVHYIATREGVDLSRVENIEDEEEADRTAYRQAPDDVYLRYVATRPRSHGLFGNIDTSDLGKVEQQVYAVTKAGRNIYRGITSLGEKDAQVLGFTDSNSWYLKMNSLMPDIAKELGISPTNFTWIGAFHAEPTHPHVHYLVWDNNDIVKSPFIHTSVQNRCRQLQEKAFFTSEYEKTLQAIFEAERDELYTLKNNSRKEITDYFKNIMNIKYVPGIKITELPPKFNEKDAKILFEKLDKLHQHLPKHGRLNYEFMPKDTKKEIDKISSHIFNRPELKKYLSEYIQASNYISQIKGIYKGEQTRKNAKADIYRRTGNIILKHMKYFSDAAEINDLNSTDIHFDATNPENLDPMPEMEPRNEEANPFPFLVDEEYLLSELETSAKQGDPHAQFALGKFYLSGEHRNIPRALELLMLSKEQNNTVAQSTLSEFYATDSINHVTRAGNYMIAWDQSYKSALHALYDTRDFDLALNLMKASAAQGNVLAYADLGKMYTRGLGCDVDDNIAQSYYKQAFLGFLTLEESSPKSYYEYRIGKLYAAGNGTDKDLLAAQKYFRLAGENKYAQYSLAKLYLQNSSGVFEETTAELMDAAKKLLRSSADQGFPYAAYDYAKLQLDDKDTACKYFSQAYTGFKSLLEQREDDMLLYRLGTMTASGLGVEKDLAKAIIYLERSAKLNNVYAQLALSKIYLSKDYPEYTNVERGLALLNKLAEQQNDSAQYCLGRFYLSNEYPEYQNIPKALQLLQDSADQGNQFAQYTLGKFYLSEEHPEYRNIPKALQLLQDSADQGNQFAQYTLGKFYLSEEHPEYRNIPKALQLLQDSADQGNQFAQYTLGKFYLSEEHPEYRNILKALQFLQDSADQGNQFAQYTLGVVYLYGRPGIEKNVVLGKEFLLAAATQGNIYASQTLEKYELLHSPLYILSNMVYSAVFMSIASNCKKKQQELDDQKNLQVHGKIAKKNKQKSEEITHL